jgi:hypothetical protein
MWTLKPPSCQGWHWCRRIGDVDQSRWELVLVTRTVLGRYITDDDGEYVEEANGCEFWDEVFSTNVEL